MVVHLLLPRTTLLASILDSRPSFWEVNLEECQLCFCSISSSFWYVFVSLPVMKTENLVFCFLFFSIYQKLHDNVFPPILSNAIFLLQTTALFISRCQYMFYLISWGESWLIRALLRPAGVADHLLYYQEDILGLRASGIGRRSGRVSSWSHIRQISLLPW